MKTTWTVKVTVELKLILEAELKMGDEPTKDDFADYFEWKNIVENDAYLTEVRESVIEKDNALELSKRLSLFAKAGPIARGAEEDTPPGLFKGGYNIYF